jgi:hypothetical protein
MNENIPKPVPHYLQSIGNIVESSGKKTGYFYPSLVFPNSIELCSVSLLYNNKTSDIKIYLATQKKKDSTPVSEICLQHEKGELVTTKIYGKPKLINAHEPFYFYHDGELTDSSIVITFKTIN